MFQGGKRIAVAILGSLVLAGSAASARANELVGLTIPATGDAIPQQAITYPGPLRANVLLPDHYDAKRAYPLLLLLHGLNDNYGSWAAPKLGDAGDIASKLDAIVVMPEGAAGWYTDWHNGGPKWESYILDQVLPTIQQHYRIRPERRYHAIVGVSMGGLGATYLGGRLPGYFGSVGSLAGFVDQQLLPGVTDAMAVVSGGLPGDVLGPGDGFYANGHNPTKLVANLRQSRVFVTAGNGTADSRGVAGPQDLVVGGAEEAALIRPMTDTFVKALRAAGVDTTFVPDAGVHQWVYFRDQLRHVLAWGLFAPVPETAPDWVNDTVATHGQLWDVGYQLHPAPDGVVHFARHNATLDVSGAHSALTITTTGGCVLNATLPAHLTIPSKSCRKRSKPAKRRRPATRRGR